MHSPNNKAEIQKIRMIVPKHTVYVSGRTARRLSVLLPNGHIVLLKLGSLLRYELENEQM